MGEGAAHKSTGAGNWPCPLRTRSVRHQGLLTVTSGQPGSRSELKRAAGFREIQLAVPMRRDKLA